jgi:tetratricopeptide (TPR) repeat protein
MLKNVEKRKKMAERLPEEEPVDYSRLLDFNKEIKKNKIARMLKWGYFLFLVIPTLYSAYYYSDYYSGFFLKYTKNTASLSQAPSLVVMHQVSVKQESDSAKLTFLLDKPTDYEIKPYLDENKLSISFKNTVYHSELPKPIEGAYIQNISTEKQQNGTRFDLQLLPGTFLKVADFDQKTLENGNKEFSIDFLKMNILRNVESYSESKSDSDINANVNSLIGKTAPPSKTGDFIEPDLPDLPKLPSLPENKEKSIDEPVETIKKKSAETRLQESYISILKSIAHSDAKSVVIRFRDFLIKHPEHHPARTAFVAFLIKQGYSEEALQILNQGVAIDPEYVPFFELKARILAKNDIRKAIDVLTFKNPSPVDYPDYYLLLATLYIQTGRFDHAKIIYKTLLDADDSNPVFWFGFALCLDKTDHISQAVEAYKQSISDGLSDKNSLFYAKNRILKIEGVLNGSEE